MYIRARDKYVQVMVEGKSHLIMTPLSTIEKALPSKFFCKIHRSYIISLAHIGGFTKSAVIIGKEKLPIAKRYKAIFKKRLPTLTNKGTDLLPLSQYDITVVLRNIGAN